MPGEVAIVASGAVQIVVRGLKGMAIRAVQRVSVGGIDLAPARGDKRRMSRPLVAMKSRRLNDGVGVALVVIASLSSSCLLRDPMSAARE